jgi:SAM-dependent methyltransferase
MVDWESRYRESKTGWDLAGPHRYLNDLVALATSNIPGLFEASESGAKTMLVPGCGFGHAGAFFAKKGCNVVSVDLSATAIQKASVQYASPSCRFVAGDIFDVSLPIDSYDVIYDRAMYCALDVETRSRYLQKCASLLKDGGVFLSILFAEIDGQKVEQGPPFAADFDVLMADADRLGLSLIFRQDMAGSGPSAVLAESLVGFLK